MNKLTVGLLSGVIAASAVFGVTGNDVHNVQAKTSKTSVVSFGEYNNKFKTNSKLAKVEKYKIFYDAPTKSIIRKMKNYDMVVIEPLLYTKEQIKEIRDSGTLVFGYISTMEVASWNTHVKEQMNDSDYFIRNGERVHYSAWDSYLTDVSSEHYRTILLNEIKDQISDKKIDGIFFDNVGDIDNEHMGDEKVLKEQRDGLVKLLTDAKNKFGLPMIQNWGFDTLKTSTVGIVDGIMWENFNYNDIKDSQWAQDHIADLKKLEHNQEVSVFTISNGDEGTSKRYAKKLGFAHYTDVNGYNVW